MNISLPIRPIAIRFPIGVAMDDQRASVGEEVDDNADPKMAVMEDPIAGMD